VSLPAAVRSRSWNRGVGYHDAGLFAEFGQVVSKARGRTWHSSCRSRRQENAQPVADGYARSPPPGTYPRTGASCGFGQGGLVQDVPREHCHDQRCRCRFAILKAIVQKRVVNGVLLGTLCLSTGAYLEATSRQVDGCLQRLNLAEERDAVHGRRAASIRASRPLVWSTSRCFPLRQTPTFSRIWLTSLFSSTRSLVHWVSEHHLLAACAAAEPARSRRWAERNFFLSGRYYPVLIKAESAVSAPRMRN